ncbi:MAG: response regulator [Chitinophagaceae bacterium]|nr:MAG: response regulator [Chitinophagaceae bacterium]
MPKDPNITIFLVDDDALCLNLYQQFLKQLGYSQVYLYDNGNDCLEQISRHKPQIIFLDYNMDGLNGLDVLKQIKQIDPLIVVIFISGQEEISIAVNTIQHGALDYIVKSSLNSEKLKTIMDRAEASVVRTDTVPKSQPSFFKRLFS